MKTDTLAIEKKLRSRLFLILALYTAVGCFVCFLLQFLLASAVNPVLKWFYWRLDVCLFLYIVCGFNVIFLHFWKKPWLFLNEIIEGTQTIYEENGQAIGLSEPLRMIENQMNQIKMSVLLGKQAAKEAEDKKNELVMYLAHDIRTPLTTVIGYLSLLSEAPDMPAEQRRKYIEITLDKAERLEKLINELFEITRYHVKTVHLKKERVDLYCLLVQLIDEFYPALSARGNTVRFEADEKLYIVADPEKLARAINNILKNASAYSYPNTEIIVEARGNPDKAVISIQNRGKTIPDDQIAGIFEKFHRLDDARASDTGGAGLGLSIAKEIIHLHNGEVSAESVDDTTTFVIMLPLIS